MCAVHLTESVTNNIRKAYIKILVINFSFSTRSVMEQGAESDGDYFSN